jgi:hypothetical protein
MKFSSTVAYPGIFFGWGICTRIFFVGWGTVRAIFTHGPKGPGSKAANFQGWHIKKIEIEVWYAGEKKAVHEREI